MEAGASSHLTESGTERFSDVGRPGPEHADSDVFSGLRQARRTGFHAPRPSRDIGSDCMKGGAIRRNDWRHKLVSLGYFRATVLITFFCVTVSAPLRAYFFVWKVGEHGVNLLREMLVSSAIPAVVVPIAVYWFMRLLYELEAAREELLQIATTDAVTQIHSRNYFMTQLSIEVERAQRVQAPVCLILMDVDHFKRINDSQGHAAGDFVLYDVAQLVRRLVRPYDVFARYGGDEFVVLMPGVRMSDACAAAERIRAAVSSLDEPCGESVPRITVSLGISSLADGEDGRGLIERADAALYQAKKMGRNRWACASDASVISVGSSKGASQALVSGLEG